MGHPTLASARRRLREMANPADAVFLQRFFKTAPGQYGEGDKFLGIRVPETRRLAKELRDLPLADVEALLQDPWHEARLLAVILLGDAYKRSAQDEQSEIFDFYLRNASRVNNWDLVDLSAPNVVGAHLLTRSRRPLDRLARSKNLWERRIAIVATYAFIRANEFDDTFRICETLLSDRHDLIHKACGWMLREVGKRDRASLSQFLDRHAATMPRTMLRYALEHYSAAERARYMALGARTRRRATSQTQ